VDSHALAEQLRTPEGAMGEEVGKAMAQYNVPANAFVFEHLTIKPVDHVLEIGFGPGEGIAEAVRLTPNGYVAGIDHSATMLSMAEERNYKALMQEAAELLVGEASALPYEDESFHVVFAVNVFHFWKDPTVELTECKRVLKPGGVIALYMAHPSSWPQGFAESGIFIAREPEEVQRMLQDCGFRETDIHISTTEDGKGFLVKGVK